jgi:hypothetical protein
MDSPRAAGVRCPVVGVARSAKAAGELEDGATLARPYDHVDLERRIRALLAAAPNRD